MNLDDFIRRFPWSEECRGMGKPLDFLWQYDFRAAPAELWPHIADTSRLNRAIGLRRRTQREINGIVYAGETLFGLPQEWVEEPWDWVAGKYFYIRRRFVRGCAKYFRSVQEIEERPDGTGVTLYVYSGWIPRNTFWRLVLRIGIPTFRKKIGRALDDFLRAQKAPEQTDLHRPAGKQTLRASAERRLQEMCDALLREDLSPAVIRRLIAYIREGDELDLHRMRILPLGRKWQVNAEDLLRVCLHATRLGLLNLTWDLVCPHCRGVRGEFASLNDLRPRGHCDICKISFDTSAPDAFEVTFHIHPSIRKVPAILYCSAEPTRKPHILAQTTVPGRSTQELRTELSDGRHRLRAIGIEPAATLDVDPIAGVSEIRWDSTRPLSAGAAKRLRITLDNPHQEAVCFVLEQLWWHNDALKPGRILALPEFHDIFAAEYLAVDVKLDLSRQTILFTDIVGSTRFYRDRGDAKAFAEVRAHFKKVEGKVRQHGGVLVKTVGDAVMSSFATPESALEAAVAIQRDFPRDVRNEGIRLRVSVHTGPVIAVNLNAGIDYFGNTVNFAAKLQAKAGAGEIALSETFSGQVYRYCSKEPRLVVREDWFKAPGAGQPEKIFVIDVTG